jgi:ankyrin repeat protein
MVRKTQIEFILIIYFSRTPLHWAAKRNHIQVVQYLLENGANKEVPAHNKSTPVDVCNDNSIRQMLGSAISDSKLA